MILAVARLLFIIASLGSFVASAQISCLSDGTAQLCDGGCARVGPCSLGCSTTSGCLGPSNVSPTFRDDLGSFVVPAGETYRLSSDDGLVSRSDGGLVRPAGAFDLASRTGFSIEPQVDAGTVGVFAVDNLVVGQGALLRITGNHPIVLKVSTAATIEGTIDVGAENSQGGPGGANGGLGGQPGRGIGGGPVGSFGTEQCLHLCAVGSAGGSFGSAGGAGGSLNIASVLPDGGGLQVMGPPADGPYGTVFLIPLVGGSGGAGGVRPGSFTSTNLGLNPQPGVGGGGGGALQLVARTAISVMDGGVITAPGEGGGTCVSSGGAAGGSGGAILLESLTILLAPGSVLAANGGGGGASDCA